ncbi:MAG: CvpA family protein [bacterium]|nr:CvpA family protein [bacterium]
MNLFDAIFLIILGLSIVLSLFRGIIREVFPVLSIIVGIVIASRNYVVIGIVLQRFVSNSNLAKIIGFSIVFLVVYVIISLIGLLTGRLIRSLSLGWVDRVGGLIFGMIKGFLIIGVIVMVISAFPVGGTKKLLDDSFFVPYTFHFIKLLLKILPQEFSKILRGVLPG